MEAVLEIAEAIAPERMAAVVETRPGVIWLGLANAAGWPAENAIMTPAEALRLAGLLAAAAEAASQ